MANDSKLGLFAGIAVMLIVAVFFGPRSTVGTAFINSEPPSAGAGSSVSTAPVKPPAATNFPDAGTHTIWQPQEPRESKPVSRDPLLWP